jgi:hypothetical protein
MLGSNTTAVEGLRRMAQYWGTIHGSKAQWGKKAKTPGCLHYTHKLTSPATQIADQVWHHSNHHGTSNNTQTACMSPCFHRGKYAKMWCRSVAFHRPVQYTTTAAYVDTHWWLTWLLNLNACVEGYFSQVNWGDHRMSSHWTTHQGSSSFQCYITETPKNPRRKLFR